MESGGSSVATSTSTIVFTDVVGSTVLRSRVGEEAADQMFRDVERTTGEAVAAHSGRVLKTAGDGIMAAFESATDAVRACVAIQQTVTMSFADVKLRVGAATGTVSWEDGDCFGMPVVTAARLQAHSEGGQILVSGVVRWLAGERSAATFQAAGALELAGISEPVDGFLVDWEPRTLASHRNFLVPLPAGMEIASAFGFVGREPEWEHLETAFRATSGGERRTVLVGGEAGAGKTRLVFEFARQCRSQGAVVLLGTCDAELAPPYQPWVQCLDQIVRVIPQQLMSELRDQLAEVSVLLPQLERMVPGLRRTPSVDPEQERYRLFQAIDAIFTTIAATRPMVVILDDVHWAAAQTLALTLHLAKSTEPGHLLVIGTFRDTADEITDPLATLLGDQHRVRNASRLRIGGLDIATVERFVADAVGHELDGPLQNLAANLAVRTAGNAFYIGELWRHLASTGAVAQTDGRWMVHAPSDSADIPESVREVVGARLVRLGPAARQIAELIAVAGLRVELRVLRSAAANLDLDLGLAIEELLKAKLVVEVAGPPTVYQFTHAIVRETIERAVSTVGRGQQHRRLAEAIERVYEADRRPVLAELARHFVAAADLGDPERAVYYARRAATQAINANAYDEAIVHLDSALALSAPGSIESIDLLLDLAEARTRASLDPEAMDLFTRAFGLARDVGLAKQTAQAVLGLGQARLLHGIPSFAYIEMVFQALAVVADSDTLLRIRLRTALVLSLHFSGRQDEATALAAEVVEEARRSGDRPVLISALLSLMVGCQDPIHYLKIGIEMQELAHGLGDLWSYCQAGGCVARAYLQMGRIEETRAALDSLREPVERGRYNMWRYQAAGLDALVALLDGRFDEAENLAGIASELLPPGTEFDAGLYGLQMYVLRREQGRLSEVAPLMKLAAASATPLWKPGLAALYAEIGMLEDAKREFLALAPGGFAAVPRDSVWPACLTFLAEVCTELRSAEHAEVLYEELESFAGFTMMVAFTTCFGPADRLRGRLAALLGRRVAALEHFRAALDLAERSGSPVWIARVKYDWAVTLGDRPDLLVEAHAIAVRVGMADLAARTAPMNAVAATPAHPLPGGLSAREVEVLRLVAAGRSNREIGEQLFISANTVANHMRAILQKTGSSNRAEATAFAARQQLLE